MQYIIYDASMASGKSEVSMADCDARRSAGAMDTYLVVSG